MATAAKTRLHDLRQRCVELQSRSSPYEQFVSLLKTVSEQEARGLLARLRSGTEIEALISQLTDGDLLLQLSVVPESRFRYDFPYMLKMPKYLVVGENPYLQSILFEGAAVNSAHSFKTRSENSVPTSIAQSPSERALFEDATYLKPFHAAEVIDVRLSQANLTYWTSVCDDNVLMRELLLIWFRCEYQFTAAFHKDLFLEDLVNQREDFCSSLMVNIILAYSCVCNVPLRRTHRAERL